jgi:hypothetical protein
MARRVFDSVWFDSTLGVVLGALAVYGFTNGAPSWAKLVSAVLSGLVLLLPVAPLLVILVDLRSALRRGLIRRGVACTVVNDAGAVAVSSRGRTVRHPLADVGRARRARNDNWSESKLVEDALGLFSVRGRELVRVPLSASGVEALERALTDRGVPVEEVWVAAPTFLD